MQPTKRRSGALIVGLISFILWMSCGYVALAYGEHTGREVIFSDLELSLFTLDKVKVEGGEQSPFRTKKSVPSALKRRC